MYRYHDVREGLTPPSFPRNLFSFYTSILIVVKLKSNCRLTSTLVFH